VATEAEEEVPTLLRSPTTKPPVTTSEGQYVPDLSIPVGGRLAIFQEGWEGLVEETNLSLVIKDGYTIPFLVKPPLVMWPPWEIVRGQKDSPDFKVIVDTLLQKLAIEEVLDWGTPGFYSSSFLVPKPNGSQRKIINLKYLNHFIKGQHFAMETPQLVLKSLRLGQWAASIDLKDAYFHIPIKVASRKYLRFMALGKVWQYRVLCFGLTTAPHLFTRAVQPLVVWARSQGIQIHAYLDDWLIVAEDQEVLKAHVQKVLNKAQDLGWLINLEKSALTPSREFAFLGMQINTQMNSVRPVQKRIEKLTQLVKDLLSKESTTARVILRLIGCMVSVSSLIPHATLERRPLQFALKRVWDGDMRSLDRKVQVTLDLRNAVLWWANQENLLSSVCLQDMRQTVTVLTDASLIGWGAHLDDQMASGIWTPQEAQNSINVLEMWAVERALKRFQHLLLGQKVQILSDNMTVVSYITKQGGTQIHNLYVQVRRILVWCRDRAISLSARHIPGNRNVLADRLSRPGLAISTEWKLDPQVFREVAQQTWYPLVDLFATRWNNQVPQFVSPFPDKKAMATDALGLDWDLLERPYLFPPAAIIQRCLEKIERSSNMFLAILPVWPSRIWYALLMRLVVDSPILLPVGENLLTQGLGRGSLKRHNRPDSMRLAAWSLSGDLLLREDFLKRLQRQQPSLRESLLPSTTSTYGNSLWAGWTEEGNPIPLKRLFKRS
jgi:hypothetical protein